MTVNPIPAMKRTYYDLRRELLDPVAWVLSRRELHRLLPYSEVNEIINAAFDYEGRGNYARIKPGQKFKEISKLAHMVQAKQPQAVLELGTRKGGTLFIWCRIAVKAKKYISIDLPGGFYGGGFHPNRERLYKEFISDRPDSTMMLLRANSQAAATRDRVRQLLGNTLLEFVFIDADHSYAGVRRDFELYEPLVVPGGVIAFHDLIPCRYDPEHEYGVGQLWDEIKERYEHYEFIENVNQGMMGIGVLIKPNQTG